MFTSPRLPRPTKAELRRLAHGLVPSKSCRQCSAPMLPRPANGYWLCSEAPSCGYQEDYNHACFLPLGSGFKIGRANGRTLGGHRA